MIAGMLRRPVAVGMFYLGVLILGVISYVNLSVEGQPDTEMPQLVVFTSWSNASPEVIQVFLTSPIEEVGAQVEGLEEMVSSSTRGQSRVTLKFNRETDMEFARLDLNERLSTLRANLPSGAGQPNIAMTERNETDNKRFVSFDISGPYDLERLSELFDDYLRDSLAGVDGVADVQVSGEREKTLRVELDRKAMELYGIAPNSVFSKIASLSSTFETPRTHLENQEYTMVIKNSIPDLEAVENLVVLRMKDKVVRVRDIGSITLGHARIRSMSRVNGNPTLRIQVEKEIGANVIETARNLRKNALESLQRMPVPTSSNFDINGKLDQTEREKNIFRLDLDQDEGLMMNEQLNDIYNRSFWCVVLIVILLLFFMQSFSAAVVITLNILFSVVITINFMYYFGVTFNVVTLSGLAIGFGMLVDNAIVVLENIFRLRELGYSRFQAAITGVQEIISAVIAATMTTVAAFLCMLLLEDRLAVAYMPLALSVIFSLSASLLVSFTLTPLLSMMIRGSNLDLEHRRNHFARLFGWVVNRLTYWYGKTVEWTLHHKMMITVITCTIFFMYLRIFITEIDSGGFSFFFGRDDRVSVFIRMPEGAELSTADDVIKKFEEPLLQAEGFRDAAVQVGTDYARMDVSFDSDMMASPFPLALKSRLISIAQGFAGVGLNVWGINSDDNYSSGSTGFENYNSNIRVLGYNYKELMDYAENVLRNVKRSPRIKSTKLETSRNSYRSPDQTETALLINRDALRQYDIDVAYLMSFLNRNLQMEATATTKYQGEEMKLEVRYSDADNFDIKDLENLVVRTPSGERIRLADLVSIVERKMPGGIDRKDQQYMVNIRWDYRGSYKRARTYNETIFNSLQLPSGFKAEMDYERDMTESESKNLYLVLIFAVIAVFMIIAALYESIIDPIVIFLTMPLSFIGVSWIYSSTGKSFDSTAYIGLIVLAGIVVNNSILLVAHINQEVRKMDEHGLTLNQAVVRAAQDRLRPILLTAITTIVGLLPLLEDFVNWFMFLTPVTWACNLIGYEFTQNLENQGLQTTLDMFSSLSRSTVGGLLSATISTLLIIPVVYVTFFRAKQWLNTRINEAFHVVSFSNKKAE